MSKTTSSKRAPLPRASNYAKAFVKDWERLSRSGRHDLRSLRQVMLLLIGNEGPLPPEWVDHPLKGDWHGYRECHVGGDFLLIYRLDHFGGDRELVIFTRAGTHADLFGK